LLAVLPALLVALGGAVLTMFRPSAIKKLLSLLWSQKLVVAPTVATLVLAVHFWPAIFPPGGAAASWQGQSDSWPMWRGSLGRLGSAASNGEDPTRGDLQWSFSTDGIKAFYCSPAVVGNRVYATGGNYVPPIRNSGAIYSIDADSGQLVWKYDGDGYRATFSSPAIAEGCLVVGEGLHWTQDSRVVCLDVAASEAQRKGVRLWSLRTASHVESSPCIYEGKAYVGAGDDGLYCIDLKPDESGQPKVIWHASGDKYLDCEPSPAAADGRVYTGLGEGGKAIICLDAATGEEIWKTDAPYPVFGSPAIADGKVVVGMGIGNYVNSAEDLAANTRRDMLRDGASEDEIARAVKDLHPGGAVWCLDAVTGEPVWKFPCERIVLGSPAVADGLVYAGSRDGLLYCLSLADGSVVRKFDAHGPIVSGAAVAAGHVYVSTQTGQVFGLDKDTLGPIWAAGLNSATMSSPAVARGKLFIGSNDGGLVCLGGTETAVVRPVWAGPQGGPAKSGRCDRSMPPAHAAQAWAYSPAVADNAEATVTSPLAWIDETLYAGVATDSSPGLAAMTISEEDGQLAKPTVKWFAASANRVVISPVATDAQVLFVDGQAGQDGRLLRCLDAATGQESWRHAVDSGAPGQLATDGETVLVADSADGISCLDLAGRLVWSNHAGALAGQPWVDGQLLFAVQGSPAALEAIDLPTGAELWRTEFAQRPTCGPVRDGDNIWVGTAGGAAAFDIVTGEQVADLAASAAAKAIVPGEDGLVLVAADGACGAIRLTDGQCRLDKLFDGADVAAGLIPAGREMLYCDGATVRRFDPAAGESSLIHKRYPSWEGAIAAPMLLVKSHVIYASEKKGLICLKPRNT
jgi:outer membrane protein assembly factor BamB